MKHKFFALIAAVIFLSAVGFSNVSQAQFIASPHGVNSDQLPGVQALSSASPHASAPSESKDPDQAAERNVFGPHASYGSSSGSVVSAYGLSGMAR